MKDNSHMAQEKPYHMCFETLGNELRIGIIKALEKKKMCVTDLSKEVGAERSRVSHSLKLLKRCKLIHSKKQGKKQIYYIDAKLAKLLESNTVLVALSCYMNKCSSVCRSKK